jgi:hypothetical protein
MIIKNSSYEEYSEIRKRYNGYCVFIVRFKGDPIEPEGGEVLAYNESLAELTKNSFL